MLKVDPDNRGAKIRIEKLMDQETLEQRKTEEPPSEEIGTQNLYQHGINQLRAGQFQDAIIKFTKFIESEPNNPNGYFKRAEAYHYELNDCQMAISDYTKAISLGIKDSNASKQQAEYYQN